MHTHLEPPHEVVPAGVDVQPPAHLLDVLELQLLVTLLVRALPELPLPYRLPHRGVAESVHELLAHAVQPADRRLPHLEHVARRGDEVQRLVRPV